MLNYIEILSIGDSPVFSIGDSPDIEISIVFFMLNMEKTKVCGTMSTKPTLEQYSLLFKPRLITMIL